MSATQSQATGGRAFLERGDFLAEYGGEGENTPLQAYGALLALYPAAFATLMAATAKRKDRLPDKVPLGDIALMGIATHKLSRLITKDWVTSPLRAPFTEYKESAGGGEVVEQSRGKGLQRAVGDLVTCPFCTGAWVAGAMGFGYFLAPRLTRVVATVFTIEAVSDFLHLAFDAARKAKQ